MDFELYHRIEPESATVRLEIVKRGLKKDIDFLNIDESKSARAKLKKALGKLTVPTLHAKHTWISGSRQIISFLEKLAQK